MTLPLPLVKGERWAEKKHGFFSVEREMDDRGSKSITGLKQPTSHKSVIVKEKRVDGSWYGMYLPYLRCILMGFERNYQIKVLSNQKRFYTTNDSNKLNPFFITGFFFFFLVIS